MEKQRRFDGQVALVTGGSRGIGAGIVRRLASEGAAVAFTYAASEAKALQLVKEVQAGGGRAMRSKLIVHLPKSCERQ